MERETCPLVVGVCGFPAMRHAVHMAALKVDKERAKRGYRGRLVFAAENFY